MDRLAYWFFCLWSAALRPLPMRAVVALGRFVGTLVYWVGGPYRRLALRNLEIAYGTEKTPAERRRLARAHFAMLVGNLFGSIKAATLLPAEVREIVELEGWERVRETVAKGRGITCAIGHYGNWELFAQVAPLVFGCPTGSIFQALSNRFFDADFRASRERLGLRLFERKEGFQDAVKMLREGGAVGILMDQHAGDAGIWCPFFGRLASTTSLPALLALRSRTPIICFTLRLVGPGRWRFTAHPPMEPAGRDPAVVTADLNLRWEQIVRAGPEEWFWVHNRWKLPYPKFLLASYKRGVAFSQSAMVVGGAGGPADRIFPGLQPFRVAVRSSNWLGDALMSVPAVRAIKRGRPDLHLTVVSPAKLADVWRSEAEVDAVIEIAPKEGVLAIARKLKAAKFEAIVLFPNSLRSALEAWWAGIPRRVGMPGHRRAWLLNQIYRPRKAKEPKAPEHHARRYLRLAEFIGADTENTLPSPRASATAALPKVWRLALCPGAEYGPAKRWPADAYGEVLRAVSAEHACEWVLVGTAGDVPLGEEILRGFTGDFRNRLGQTTMEELVEELRACDLLLTNDTGTMHLAAHLGLPTVALFGSTEPALTGPLGGGHQVLRHHVECSPCFLRSCPIDFRCMHAITVAEVVTAVERAFGVDRTEASAPVSSSSSLPAATGD